MTTPITAFYASLIGAFYLYLSAVVIQQRRKLKIGIGHGKNHHFHQLLRVHGNFAEYVPFAVTLMLVAELNTDSDPLLHLVGVSLLIGRMSHAFGLRHHVGVSWQRALGVCCTFFAMGLTIYLCLSSFYLEL